MRNHPVFARVYDRLARAADRMGEREHRIEVAGGAKGRVLEIGSGTGMNFEHYPEDATVLALEPEPTMLRLARPRAIRAAADVTFVRASAERLPFPDASFDAVVATLVLCSISEPAAALSEAFRVLRPGGELRFFEHVRARSPRLARWQDRLERVWGVFAGGCHPNRDSVAAIRDAGFAVGFRRLNLGLTAFLVRPHALGIGHRT